MLQKEITFENEDGEKVTKTFYFNLTKAETVRVTILEDLEHVSQSSDPKAIIPVFENIVRATYGIRLPDGRFVKPKEEAEWFISSDAYSELFFELLRDGEQGMADFVNAIMPKGLGNASANVPERAVPQDYQRPQAAPSAREQFEERRRTEVSPEQPVWPSDAYRVPPEPRLHDETIQAEEDGPTPEELAAWRASRRAASQEQVDTLSRPPHESGSQG